FSGVENVSKWPLRRQMEQLQRMASVGISSSLKLPLRRTQLQTGRNPNRGHPLQLLHLSTQGPFADIFYAGEIYL
ncbi:MAG: hypothetical protein RLN85_08880, partial [Pseudomonadales bacterium]